MRLRHSNHTNTTDTGEKIMSKARNIYFLLAGIKTDNENIFFLSRNRHKTIPSSVVHNNKHSTFWKIPSDVFKANFKYNHKTGQYEPVGELRKFKDIEKYAEIFIHDGVGVMKTKAEGLPA